MVNIIKIPSDVHTIYFVCSGNIIRSAFAELWSKHYIKTNIRFSSFGVVYQNTKIHPMTARYLQLESVSNEIINSFKPRHVSQVSLEPNSYFFAMTNDHVKELSKFTSKKTIFLLTELLNHSDEIEDPYFTDNYSAVYNKIVCCLKELEKSLKTSSRN